MEGDAHANDPEKECVFCLITKGYYCPPMCFLAKHFCRCHLSDIVVPFSTFF